MKKSFRYRFYPTRSQTSKLENILSMCRYLYNWSLLERIDAYKKEKRTISYIDQQNKLPDLKKQRPWFKGVYSLVLQDVLRRLDKSYKKFFREKKGFPKFRKKGQYTSICYAQYRSCPINNILTIPKIGDVKLRYHRKIPKNAKIKTLTLIKEGGKWFCSFSLEIEEQEEPKHNTKSAIGIDLGLEHFIYTSNNLHFDAFKAYKSYGKNLKKLQRKLKKTTKRTKAYQKVLKALQKAHYRIKCKRVGYHHYLIGKILKDNDVIFYEDLDICNMVKKPEPIKDKNLDRYLPNGAKQQSHLNRSILDVSWGSFIKSLILRAKNAGKQTYAVNPKGTTQRCFSCSNIVFKTLKDRIHDCPFCGVVLPRDYNSALEILRLGLESLGLVFNKTLEAPTIM